VRDPLESTFHGLRTFVVEEPQTRQNPGMRTGIGTLFLLPLLAGCQTISNAPSGQPRVELEIAVEIEPQFQQALPGADHALAAQIAGAVLAEADVGLRFYPVASGDYSEGQTRPPYLMTVRVASLDFEVSEREREGEVLADVDVVRAGVDVTLQKRRDNGPALLVATADTSVRRRPPGDTQSEGAVEASYSIRRDGTAPARVAGKEIVAAVSKATREAFGRMIPAIDREFADERAAAKAGR